MNRVSSVMAGYGFAAPESERKAEEDVRRTEAQRVGTAVSDARANLAGAILSAKDQRSIEGALVRYEQALWVAVATFAQHQR